MFSGSTERAILSSYSWGVDLTCFYWEVLGKGGVVADPQLVNEADT